MSKITMYRGDAVEVLKSLPDGAADAAVFDPPYPTISGGSNESGKGRQRPSGILSKNDGRIFAHNDIKPGEYLPEVFRVLRDDAHLYMMTNTLNLCTKDVLGDLHRAGFQIHNLLFWRKNTCTPNRWYMKDVELTILARKGKAFPINNPGSRSTLSVFPHPLDWDNVPAPKSHPTEKPVNLMKTYIENSTQPGEVVLDPFAGTGAIGVAAQESGRGFIGIEVDDAYADIARERLGLDSLARLTGGDDEIDDLLGGGSDAEVEDLLA